MKKLFRRLALAFGAAATVHPDGQVYVRINDHWLPI